MRRPLQIEKLSDRLRDYTLLIKYRRCPHSRSTDPHALAKLMGWDAKLSVFVTPMAAHAVEKLPEGAEWLYELKFDGYRALLLKDATRIQVRSRNDKDLTRMYPAITTAASRLNAETATVDGEIVALDEEGRPAFQALQHRSSHPQHKLVFYAFDLLHLNGADLTALALVQRREKLLQVINESGLLLSQDLPGAVSDIVRSVQALGLEGVVAKRKHSIYQPGERSQDWQKLKLESQQEFVIGGYRPVGDAIDALLVGYYDGKQLRFAGKVRAGFVPNVRRQLFEKLKPLRSQQCSFSDLPNPPGSSRWGGGITADEMHEMQWVRPACVAQVRFIEWTAEGRLRLAKYVGLRADKNPRDVRREG
jgi:bifunctional non-homologous end joining protein LigD